MARTLQKIESRFTERVSMRDDLEERRAFLHALTNKVTPLAARLRLAVRIDAPARRDAHICAALQDLDVLCEWVKARSQELAREICQDEVDGRRTHAASGDRCAV